MREEVKQAWIEALESGRYKQGEDVLRRVTEEDGECFCALGVLCDISGRGEWMEPDYRGESPYAILVGVLVQDATWKYLPGDVARWAGVDDLLVQVRGETVAGRNDGGATFAEIAALLRATPAEEIL